MRFYALQFLIALDQLANTLLGGYADETLSARAWRADQNGKVLGRVMRPLIDALSLVITFGRDRNHCRDSYESEVQRRQFPQAYSLESRP